MLPCSGLLEAQCSLKWGDDVQRRCHTMLRGGKKPEALLQREIISP